MSILSPILSPILGSNVRGPLEGGGGGGGPADPLHADLAAWWTFDDTLADAHGSASTWTLVAGTTSYEAGKVNNSLSCSGSDSWHAPYGDVSTGGDFTWCAWVEPDRFTSSGTIFEVSDTSTQRFMVYQDSNTWKVILDGSIVANHTMGDGWHMLSFRHNGGTNAWAWWWNNALKSSGTTALAAATGSNLKMSTSSLVSTWRHQGQIEEMAWWNRYLTDDEIATDLYNSGNGRGYTV